MSCRRRILLILTAMTASPFCVQAGTHPMERAGETRDHLVTDFAVLVPLMPVVQRSGEL